MLVLLLAVGTAAALAAPAPTLVIADSDSGAVLYSTTVSEGTTLELDYTHSVERSPVTEHYRITDGQLQQTRIIFESYGWGLPTGADVERIEGQFHAPMDRNYDELMITPGPIADQRLTVGGTQLALYELAGRSSVRISIEYRRWLGV
jgi:Uncharacterized conserved protein